MKRLTARDFAPELLELYDGYVHGRISRRQFLDRAGIFAVGGLTAAGILAALSPDYALAQQVQFTDPEIVAEYIRYPSPNGHGEVRGYLVRPARAEGPLPGVLAVRSRSCRADCGSAFPARGTHEIMETADPRSATARSRNNRRRGAGRARCAPGWRCRPGSVRCAGPPGGHAQAR